MIDATTTAARWRSLVEGPQSERMTNLEYNVDLLTEAQVKTAEALLQQAILHGNTDVLETLLSDDLVFVRPDGSFVLRGDDFLAHECGEISYLSMDLLAQEIRLFGSVAVVSSVSRNAGVFRGRCFDGAYQFLRVWVYTKTKGVQVVAGGVRELVGR